MVFPRSGQYSVFPQLPTDGQVFIDSEYVRWVFDKETDLWERAGTVDGIPVATSISDGLLSRQLKTTLDIVPAVGGGFGIIVDPKFLMTSPTNPQGVITGNIQLRSDSLDIACVAPNKVILDCAAPPALVCEYPGGRVPELTFSVSEKFLSTLFVDLSGPTGKKGFTGGKGDTGKHGFSEGPRGDKGLPGANVTELFQLTDIVYNDIDGITDTAIVNLNLVDDSGHGCKLIVTKAKLDISDNQPADKVAAKVLSRTLIYDPDAHPLVCDVTRLDNWRLVQAPGDATPLNLQLLRYPKGSNDRENDPIGVSGTLSLTSFVQGIVAEYKDRLTKLDQTWGKQVKQFIENIDDSARNILSDLAQQLTLCEFNLPAIEYCITFKGCPSPSVAAAGRAAIGSSNLPIGVKNWSFKT